uniref:Immunoglobulin domain-containing protein n=1 Tax=Salarias fasciatus TaxID=181472 RepID=A0A672GX35_SALFA
MTSVAFETVLFLCSLSWIHLSLAHTVEVQSGEDATLLCPNTTIIPSLLIWFRFMNRSEPHCVAKIFRSDQPASFCGGAESNRFEVSSNMSTIFLKIKNVTESDSALYFCGYKISGHPVIVQSVYLKTQEKPTETTSLATMILSMVTLILTKVTICFVIKMRTRTGMKFMRSEEEQDRLFIQRNQRKRFSFS